MNRTTLRFSALYFAAAVLTPVRVAAQTPRTPAIRAAPAEVFEAIRPIYEYNRRAPLRAEVTATREFRAYTREKIVFTGVLQTRVPGYLVLPKSGTKPFPIVLLLHGITSSKEGWYDTAGWERGTRLIDPLVAAGIAVLTLDARYHGERIADNGYVVPRDINDVRDLVVETVIEHRRALDYVATRSEIDTARIGVLGLSMGALEAFALTAVDLRVKVTVAGVTPVGRFKDGNTLPVAPQTFAGTIRTTPLLMLMGRADEYYTVDEAQQLFATIATERKELVFYDSGHRMPPDYTVKAVEWLRQYLK